MRNKIFFLAAILSIIFSFCVCSAEIPHLISYQGKITDKDNKPLDGAYNITFKLFPTITAGTAIWQEILTGASVQKGLVSVILGNIQSLKNIPFDKPYFLEITVNNEILTPRQQITSVAYAKRADKADNLVVTGQKYGDILYFDGTKWSSLAAGAKGQFLRTQGPGANPVWNEFSFIHMQVFTSSGTWIRPAGVSKVYVKVWGAGGGGSNGGGTGGIGGASIFAGDTIVQATGGTGGFQGGVSGGSGGIGGLGSGGIINLNGSNGSNGYIDYSRHFTSGTGGSSPFGGAGAGPLAAGCVPGGGAGGYIGGGGGGGGYSEGLVSVTGDVAATVGVGGVGAYGGSSAPGANGLVIVSWYE